MIGRRSAILSLLFSLFLQGTYGTLTFKKDEPRTFTWNMDGVSEFRVTYHGQTVTFTPAEVMAALQPSPVLVRPDQSLPVHCDPQTGICF